LKRAFCLAIALTSLAVLMLRADPPQTGRHIQLPTSKLLTSPSPGYIGRLNSFPATIATSPDGRYAALLNDGYGTQATQAHQSISILDLQTNQLADFPDDRLPESAHQSYFLGLAFSSDGTHLYASIGSITDPAGEKLGNTGNGIAVYRFQQGKVMPERFLKMALQKIAADKRVAYGLRKVAPGTAVPYPAGLAVIATASGDRLLVANNLSDNVVLLDPADGRILKQFDLSTHQIVPTSFPYTVVASRDGRRAWCSLWNASRVAELDLEKETVRRWIPLSQPDVPVTPGSHPTALLLSPDEKLLYVALSNADRVAVVHAMTGTVLSFLDTMIPGQKYGGSYPTALAQSADGTRVFVADSSLNAIAVFQKPQPLAGTFEPVVQEALGFIPTDWYPSALATAGNQLLIASAKGQSTGPNNGLSELKQERRHHEHPYIPTLLYGSLSRLDFRDAEKRLPELTRTVEENNLLHSDPGQVVFARGANPIRHVIYVLRENRTYDQILGDLKVGNGDPSLTMYGGDITPNAHKLALQFGVLDNFYDSGEVSGNGHVWSNAAITSDYNEKTWQIGYRSEERTYDYQGNMADELPLETHQPNVDAPATGFLWDNLARHGVSYRDYGEFMDAVWCEPPSNAPAPPPGDAESPLHAACPRHVVRKGEPLPSHLGQPHGSPSPWPWAVPLLMGARPTTAALVEHFDPDFPDFNTEYPDQLRADEFLNEFEGFVRARTEGKGTQLPAFVLLYLPDDHTMGTRPGRPRPAASVADNDLALGRVVEAVSHSPYWEDTAIFVIEDDAQDGADHVDAHRSIALVISKYSPGSAEQPFVDHHFYTTVNMVHTIEALLGLPPMNQNDAYAPVMAPLFTGAGDQPAFTADYRNRDNGLMYQVNPGKTKGAAESEKMDFSRPDAVNTALLNAILWHDRKGDTPMPAPRHTVFPQKAGRDDD
jgi:DNA-binding beta-propeller fold protein YncE